MGTVVFHVTSAKNRASIRRYGLDWTRMADELGVAGSLQPEAQGVFLARDIEEAEWFAVVSQRNHDSVDIWEVTLRETFDVYGDPPHGLPYVEIGGYLATTQPIPREQLRLLDSKDAIEAV